MLSPSNSWPITVGAEKAMTMKDEDIWDRVVDLLLNKRSYASYFHFKDDREGTEVDVVRNWIDARRPSSKDVYKAIRHCPPPFDPPDVVAATNGGETHGFEVTELVDAETARRIERDGTSEFKEYSRSELVGCIRQRVERKARKPFRTACDKSFLLIYSDEPALWSDTALLSGVAVPKSALFSEIWLMLPPEVNISGGEPKNPHCQIFPVRQI